MADYTGSMDACGVPYERLDADEVMRRWPQWRLDPDTVALYQAAGGIAPPILANEAHRTLACGTGATLLDEMPVTRPALDERRGGGRCRRSDVPGPQGLPVRRRLDERADGTARHDAAADHHQGAGHLLGLARTCPTSRRTASRSGSGWTCPASTASRPSASPAPRAPRTWAAGRRRPATRDFAPDPEAFARLDAFMAAHLPTALGPVLYTKTCLYTMPPDRDFVIDAAARPPGHPRRPGRGARLQVRLALRAHLQRAGGGRRQRLATSSRSASTGRSCAIRTRRRASWSEGSRGDSRASSCDALRVRIVAIPYGSRRLTLHCRMGDTGHRRRPGGAGRDLSGADRVARPAAVRGGTMLTSARARVWRPVLILAALAAMLLPSVAPVAAADPVVLRVGETQDVTAINPYLADALQRLRGLHAQLRPPRRLRPGRASRRPASPRPGRRTGRPGPSRSTRT